MYGTSVIKLSVLFFLFCNLLRSTPLMCLSLDKCCCMANRFSAVTFTLHIVQNNTNPSEEKILCPNSCTNARSRLAIEHFIFGIFILNYQKKLTRVIKWC